MLNVPIAVKKALKEGTYKKNYRFVVLNDDGTTDFIIDNDTLVAESVTIDERMATGSELKFGLCEGSSLEFQYFDHDNIRGRQLKVFLDVEYGESTPYSIPMGFFTVKNCSMQFSTGIYKATAYNKLQSDYLDAEANALISDNLYNKSTAMDMYSIRKILLNNYEIQANEEVSYSTQKQVSIIINVLNKELKFTSLNACDTPFNAREFERIWGAMPSTSSTVYLYVFTRQAIISVDQTEPGSMYQIREPEGHSLSEISEAFTAYLSNLINSSFLNKTGEAVLNTINQQYTVSTGYENCGWGHVLSYGMWPTTASSYKLDFYSDYPYKHNQTLADYPIIGTSSDLVQHLIPKQRQIVVYIPREVRISYGSVDGNYVELSLEDGCDYLSSDGTIKHYPGMKYLDGSDYDVEDFVNNVEVAEILGLQAADKVTISADTAQKYTLREITSAVYENACQFGQLDRETDLFSGVELNGGGLYPAETLYPANSLFPNNGTGGKGFHPYPSEYSKLWTDTQGEQSFRYLYITYKTLDENNNEVDAVLQRTVNADGTTDYNMSDNWLFRNLVWTAADVGDYADAMVTKMQGIKWFPFEMWAAGLPYVETGDAIEITDRNGGSHVSYVLQRQLQGIQNLQDTYINGELDIF